MADPKQLQDKAIAACRAHVEETFEGDFLVEPLTPETRWSSRELRHVFEQPMEIWRALSDFEVLLDPSDRPAGFVDHDKWVGCGAADLPEPEAVDLALATGLVPDAMVLADARTGERGCVELVFEEAEAKPARRVAVRINPRRKAVISVVPGTGAAP